MIELSNRAPVKVKMEWRQEVVDEFDRFVAFAAEHQDHANRTNVLEYIIEQFMRTSLSRDFREWAKSQEENAETDEAEIVEADVKKKEGDSTPTRSSPSKSAQKDVEDAKPSVSKESLQRAREEIEKRGKKKEKVT